MLASEVILLKACTQVLSLLALRPLDLILHVLEADTGLLMDSWSYHFYLKTINRK